MREIANFIDLRIELVAREPGQAIFGGACSEQARPRVRMRLTCHIAAFKRLAKFAPYAAGETFTIADCSAWAYFPAAALATQAVLGDDPIAAGGIDWKGMSRSSTSVRVRGAWTSTARRRGSAPQPAAEM